MGTLNRKELDHLERRELQLTILAAVIVLVLAGGLAAFMYPLVFLHPVGNKLTLRVAFFGFCALTDRKSTRLNSSHSQISYAVFCLTKKSSRAVGPARGSVGARPVVSFKR